MNYIKKRRAMLTARRLAAHDAFAEGNHPRDALGQFAAGRSDAIAGKKSEDNSHKAQTFAHGEWHQGHNQVATAKKQIEQGEKPMTHKQAAAKYRQQAEAGERNAYKSNETSPGSGAFSGAYAYLAKERAAHHDEQAAAGKKNVAE